MSEAALSFRLGAQCDLQVLIIEPLFEEANRCRRLLAQIMRLLERDGIGSTIAVLPGTGESMVPIAEVQLSDWRNSLAGAPTTVASLRGGALIDDAVAARGHWRFAPETGARLVRDLKRTALTGSAMAGHAFSPAFLAEIEAASPAPLSNLRTLRLETDTADADIKVAGSPLWRRAEPGEDAGLATILAEDLSAWTRQCAGL